MALLRHDERDQHAHPNDVEKMPIAGTMIDSPVTFVIVSVSVRLKDDEAKKHHASQDVKCVDERQRKRHTVYLHRTIRLAEMLGPQVHHAEHLDQQER